MPGGLSPEVGGSGTGFWELGAGKSMSYEFEVGSAELTKVDLWVQEECRSGWLAARFRQVARKLGGSKLKAQRRNRKVN